MNTGAAPHPILWIIGLVTAIIAAVMATLIDSYIKGDDLRAHHGVQIFNDCLAEQFGVYIVYFFAFAIGTKFSKYWGTGLLAIAVLLSICFYVRGVRSTTRHDKIIFRDRHRCIGVDCDESLEFMTAWRIYGLNLVFAVLMFALVCYLAAISTSSPTQ